MVAYTPSAKAILATVGRQAHIVHERARDRRGVKHLRRVGEGLRAGVVCAPVEQPVGLRRSCGRRAQQDEAADEFREVGFHSVCLFVVVTKNGVALCGLTNNVRRLVQPILFHEMSVSWTEIAVQHILMPFMTPQSVSTKSAGTALVKFQGICNSVGFIWT